MRRIVMTDVWRYWSWSYCGEVPVERGEEGSVEQGCMGQSECFFCRLARSQRELKLQMANTEVTAKYV